ncbi:MAG: hypothetical protein DWQ01_18240 [Planctomycetota bacterium]|nr:MAG: hypothetical protein DWQ01_18240 [Planctomycetota bacterium]
MKSVFTLGLLVFAAPLAIAQRIGGEWELALKIQGQYEDSFFGHSIAGPGDLNGDGYPDLVVGAPYQNSEAGMVYAYSGRNGQLLWQWSDGGYVNMAGTAVSGAGDVNGDGFPDVAVGIYKDDRVWVLLNDGTPWWSIQDFAVDHGSSICSGGDINLDGFDDVVVGADNASPNGETAAGKVFVYSGLDGAVLFEFDGSFAGDHFGGSIAGGRDFDLDGFPDILIGAPLASRAGVEQVGVCYVVSGQTGGNIFEIVGPLFPFQGFGSPVAGLEDVNSDGYPDFMVSATGSEIGGPGTGSVFVFSGFDGMLLYRIDGREPGETIGFGIDSVQDLDFDQLGDLIISVVPNANIIDKVQVYSGVNGELLDVIDGPSSDEGFGKSIATMGDLSGNGLDAIAVGAKGEANGNLVDAGAVYIYNPNPFIFADATELSASSGVPVQILMSFPESEANTKYALLLSGAGTGPTTIAGLEVPLGQSLLLSQMLTGWAPFNLHGAFGTLDVNAQATATLDSDPTLAGLVGTTFYMAAVTYDSTPTLASRRTSIAWPIRITL